MRSGFAFFLTLIVVTATLMVAGVIYFLVRPEQLPLLLPAGMISSSSQSHQAITSAETYPTASIHQRDLDPTRDWTTYRNEEFGYEIRHPNEWAITEARLIKDVGQTFGARDVLFEELNELHKVTFSEEGYLPGSLQVRVISNSEHQPLDEWASDYFAGESLTRSVTDEVLSGRRAIKLSTFEFDSYSTVIITASKGYIYYLYFSNFDPNDPEEERHRLAYKWMLSSFKFIK